MDGRQRNGERSSWRIALVGLLTFALLSGVAEWLVSRDERGARTEAVARVESEASAIRATVEAELNRTLYLAVGIAGYAKALPDLGTDEQVEALLADVFDRGDHIRNIGLAPDNVISHVYPLAGNEAALGLAYEDVPEQWVDVRRAMVTRRTVLAGPLQLRQGGTGLINRTPVFLDDGSYWGIVSLVLDVDALLTEVRGRVEDAPVTWALRAVPDDGPAIPITGDQAAFDDADVVQPVAVPEGRWELAADAGPELRPSATRTPLLRGTAIAVSAALALLLVLLLRERETVRRQARQDPLTALANRRHLEAELDGMIATARRKQDRFALVFVDLDDFKAVNDHHGHAVGDLVLGAVADRLADAVRDTDVVARVGGDEFIVLLRGVDSDVERSAAARKLAAALDAPIELGGHVGTVVVGASIGVGAYPTHGDSASALISRIDGAMYAAKARRGDRPSVRLELLDGAGADPVDGPTAAPTGARRAPVDR